MRKYLRKGNGVRVWNDSGPGAADMWESDRRNIWWPVTARCWGSFFGRDIYDQDGYYVGELGRNDRLIRNRTKSATRRPAFSRSVKGTIQAPLRDCAPYPLIYGLTILNGNASDTGRRVRKRSVSIL